MNTVNLRKSSNFYKEHILYPYGDVSRNNLDNRLNIKSGDGIWLISKDDRKYIDAISGLWNVSLGYKNIRIENSIKKQIDDISFCSLFDHTNDIIIKNSNKILSLHNNNMNKVCYTCSGSESIELAIKLMRKYWDDMGFLNKKTILSFSHSYHGTSYGALTISHDEDDYFNQYKPGIEAVEKIDICRGDYNNCGFNSGCNYCQKIEKFICDKNSLIAGIIIEPIILSMGVKDICKKLLNKIIELCNYYDLLISVDEVATGFYRTGAPFYYQKLNLFPDIICMSKGINSGYLPLGAVCFNKKIEDVIADSINKCIIHGSTQGGNVLSCAASNTAIDIYNEMFNDDTSLNLVKNFSVELNEKLKDISYIDKVVSKGFLICIEFSNEKFRFNLNDVLKIKDSLKKSGLIVYGCNDGILMLPMFITNKDEYNLIISKLVEYFHYN